MTLKTPFTITSEATVFQYNFILTDYGIQFIDESSPDKPPAKIEYGQPDQTFQEEEQEGGKPHPLEVGHDLRVHGWTAPVRFAGCQINRAPSHCPPIAKEFFAASGQMPFV